LSINNRWDADEIKWKAYVANLLKSSLTSEYAITKSYNYGVFFFCIIRTANTCRQIDPADPYNLCFTLI